jgi:hypothetical protein
MSSSDNGVRDIFSRLGALEAKTDMMHHQTVEHAEDDQRVHTDHEHRIREQEIMRAKVVGAAALGGTITSVIGWLLSYIS